MGQHGSPRYCSYLLRCWQEASLIQVRGAAWRFSLEDPHTGERLGFASFEALMVFLHGKLIDEPIVSSVMAGEELERDHAE